MGIPLCWAAIARLTLIFSACSVPPVMEEITPEKALVLSQILEAEGGRAYAQSNADRLTDLALTALENANPGGEAGEILRELAKKMLKRQN